MILVATDIWVASTDSSMQVLAQTLADLLERGDVLGHEFVLGELMLGTVSPKRQVVIDKYGDLDPALVIPAAGVYGFIEMRKLANKGVGWVGVNLLASAASMRTQIWTEEAALKKLAVELGIAFEMQKVTPE